MVIPFAELKKHTFSVSDVNAFFQKPVYRRLEIKSRTCNGFLWIVSGEGEYRFKNGSLSVAAGSVIYLPLGSKHTLIVTSPAIEFYRIDFTIRTGNEPVLFSTVPCILTDAATPECARAVYGLEKHGFAEKESIFETKMICALLAALQTPAVSLRAKKLAPAVSYIQEHLTEGFSCRALAALCYISTSQFYALFTAEYGMTPLEYRNRFLLQRAKVLLRSEGISVSEAAYMLGFDNPSYFSRLFKKHFSISPKAFQTQRSPF